MVICIFWCRQKHGGIGVCVGGGGGEGGGQTRQKARVFVVSFVVVGQIIIICSNQISRFDCQRLCQYICQRVFELT